jgi:hypothetical protein
MSIHDDSTPAQQYLRQSLTSVLMLDAARNLDFWCNGVHVSGAGLGTVYWALMSHELGVLVDPTLPPRLARYMPLRDTFVFQSYNYGDRDSMVANKALIVHESIHAMIDVAHVASTAAGVRNPEFAPWTLMTTSASEAVAYMAQTMFMINALGSLGSTAQPIFIIAGRIAEKIKDEPGAMISADDSALLEKTILDDPDYHDRLLADNVLSADGIN